MTWKIKPWKPFISNLATVVLIPDPQGPETLLGLIPLVLIKDCWETWNKGEGSNSQDTG